MPKTITVCEELSERYEGDAEKLAEKVFDIEYYKLESQFNALLDGVKSMLQNGCFCPSCLNMYLEDC